MGMGKLDGGDECLRTVPIANGSFRTGRQVSNSALGARLHACFRVPGGCHLCPLLRFPIGLAPAWPNNPNCRMVLFALSAWDRVVFLSAGKSGRHLVHSGISGSMVVPFLEHRVHFGRKLPLPMLTNSPSQSMAFPAGPLDMPKPPQGLRLTFTDLKIKANSWLPSVWAKPHRAPSEADLRLVPRTCS